MALNANTAVYRFVVLFFNCLLTFGTYFCFDMPSVLQTHFTCNVVCANDSSTTTVGPPLTTTSKASSGSFGVSSTAGEGTQAICGGDCLGMTDSQYNLLYAIYAWTNAVVVIGAGVLIDKLGIRVGLFLFSSLCLVGSILFALGSHFKGTAALLPVMLLGRLLFGSGNGSLTIVQNKITAFWFKDKELALAFGITLAFSRLGSVLNFFLTETFNEAYSLTWTLWGGTMLVGLGFISAIVVSILDKTGAEQLGASEEIKAQSKRVRLSDIKDFTLSYWLLSLTIVFFYNGVFPFVADASKFISTKYKFDNEKTPSYIAGAVYDCSMILSPFLGGLIDVIGKRGYLAVLCATLTIPVFGILAFTSWYPLIATLWLGITYSFAASSTWPSIPLVVKDSVVGTAMGITTSMQMIGIGICNLVVGLILGNEKIIPPAEQLSRWKYVMIFLLANTLACVLCAVFLNINDRRKNGILNISRSQRKDREMTERPSGDDSADIDGEETDCLIPKESGQSGYGAVET